MDYQQLIQRNLKKITIGLAIVGVASLTIWYMRNQKQPESEELLYSDESKEEPQPQQQANESKPKPHSKPELEPEPDSEPKKKKKKKKIDPQARMKKLLAKQNKRHGQSEADSAAPDYESDEDDSNLDPDSKDWKEFVQLLSIKGIYFYYT